MTDRLLSWQSYNMTITFDFFFAFFLHILRFIAKQFNCILVAYICLHKNQYFDNLVNKQLMSRCVYLWFGKHSLFARHIRPDCHSSTYKVLLYAELLALYKNMIWNMRKLMHVHWVSAIYFGYVQNFWLTSHSVEIKERYHNLRTNSLKQVWWT